MYRLTFARPSDVQNVLNVTCEVDTSISTSRNALCCSRQLVYPQHPDVFEALSELPQIDPVWLPTYAPWLNPIEKLWRWLRVDVLKMHRFVSQWGAFRTQVNGFLDQCATSSDDLLRYVGLKGDGLLVTTRISPTRLANRIYQECAYIFRFHYKKVVYLTLVQDQK